MKKYLVLFSAFLFSATVFGQSVFGKWKTIDDETGKPKSIVEVYKENGKVYGKIVEILNPEKQDAICEECDEDDPRYNQRILGMVIMKDLEYDADDEEWDDGNILDPNNGTVYDCKIWLADDGNLKVRGYVAFFFRTQTWKRVN